MRLNVTVLAALAAVVLTGCVSEQERIAQAAAEKERQEQLAKEARERKEQEAKQQAEKKKQMRQLWRASLAGELASAQLKLIREAYSQKESYVCRFPRKNKRSGDWLAVWTEPRSEISNADKLAGEALLSEFGAKHLPNAYANYEKVKNVALELQQVFNEEFPEPWKIDNANTKWNSFNKALERFAKAREEYFLCHDELCHYWMRWRFGILSAEDFAKIDSEKLAVYLLPENFSLVGYAGLKAKSLDGKLTEFADKYAPESYAVYQKLQRELKEQTALLVDVSSCRRQMDQVRFDFVWDAAIWKLNDIARTLNSLVESIESWYADHRTMEKTSEDVAKQDRKTAVQLKPFLDSLPQYIKDRAGSVIPKMDMVTIPGKKFRMQRTEVTQFQWMVVMEVNPSDFKSPDHPVENVSWDDCQAFIKKLNAMVGANYRLPTEAEWEYACRAGGTSDWGRRRNGVEGPLDVMGWSSENSGGHTHLVAMKEPNVWGLYDMHGNVNEWCIDMWKGHRSYRVLRGGGWGNRADLCTSSYRSRDYPSSEYNLNGFRLVRPLSE